MNGRSAAESASISEICEAVSSHLGNVPSSSVRSYLNIKTPELFERTERGRYKLRKFTRRFASEVSFIPEADTKVVELIKSIKGDNGAVDKVKDILKSVNTVIAKGATFKEFGTSSQEATVTTSSDEAWAVIEKAAADLVVKGKVSKAISIQMAIVQNPDLYKTYTDALRNE